MNQMNRRRKLQQQGNDWSYDQQHEKGYFFDPNSDQQQKSFARHAEYFADVFINNWHRWAWQSDHSDSNVHWQYNECAHSGRGFEDCEFSSYQVEQHLKGHLTMGLIAIDELGGSRFFAWDEDNLGGRLERIGNALADLNFTYLRVTGRKDRAGHLFVLFENPIHASDLEIFRQIIEKNAGIRHPQLTGCKCCRSHLDHFPNVPKVSSDPKYSNIRAPLGINRKKDAGWNPALTVEKCDHLRGWFEGPEKNILSQLIWLKKQPINKAEKVLELVESIRKQTRKQDELVGECNTLIELCRRRENLFAPKRIRSLNSTSFRHLVNAYCEAENLTLKQIGRDFAVLCPLCTELEDGAKDNLRLKGQGPEFNCFAGMASGHHTPKDIYRYLKSKYGKTLRCVYPYNR